MPKRFTRTKSVEAYASNVDKAVDDIMDSAQKWGPAVKLISVTTSVIYKGPMHTSDIVVTCLLEELK